VEGSLREGGWLPRSFHSLHDEGRPISPPSVVLSLDLSILTSDHALGPHAEGSSGGG